ncbi:ABC transporter permease [Sandarakinorhabdus limnophila]|uniref:ABC transporter permease n=1 Tax=Sandarakinorhabdus limnophila TaxID=210512 RepID=UPI0026ED4BDC|nr:ABC transporter permease [Sandarakinorhabdus limnophila]MCM0032099.1 ABC transporter permease [Sandarakinorhabdus limnophila]
MMLQRPSQAPGVFASVGLPPVVWLFALFLAPLAVIWTYSFGENRTLVDIAITGSWGNYARALKPLYLAILLKSMGFAALTTVLCFILGLPVALAITFASRRAKLLLLVAIMLPFWTNLLIRTYALMAILRTEGLINAGLGALWGIVPGLPPFEPLPLINNNFAVVVGLVYVHLPFMVLPLYAALDRLDGSLIEASLDLGAGHLATLWRVVVPLALPGIVSGIIITFIPALGAYLTPDLLGGTNSQMIANVIERQFRSANDWPFGAALSFLLMYLTFAALMVQAIISRRSANQEGAR